MTFWTEYKFCFISDCRNSFNYKPKRLMNNQMIIFYSSSMHFVYLMNACIQNILSTILSLVCVPVSLGSICKYWILLMKKHRVLYRPNKCANVCYCKKQVFFIVLLLIYNQNLTRFHGVLLELEILEMFTTAFLLKTIIWTWLCFKYSRVLSLKTKKNLKKYASHVKIAWHSKRQKQSIEKKRKKNEKWEKVKEQQ